MGIRVAVQMDPMDGINIAGDSSFALMLAAQARGYDIWHYDVGTLTLDANDRLTALAHPVHDLQRVEGAHYRFGEPKRIDLGSDIDVVLMRQDPPFHVGYITATHLLERIESETLVVNNPASVRNAPEKVMVLDYRHYHAADFDYAVGRRNPCVPERAWGRRHQAAPRQWRQGDLPRARRRRQSRRADGGV